MTPTVLPPRELHAAGREEPPPRRKLTIRLAGLMRKMAVRGALWTIGGQASSAGLRLLTNLILSRLLTPTDFGLSALCGVIMVGLEMFSDLGITPAIVRDPKGDDPRFLNTAWTIQIVRGFILWTIASLLAWPVAWLYGSPRLLELIPLVAVTAILSGFASTGLAIARRRVQLGRLMLVELSAQVVAAIVMLVWAFQSPTVYALIFGGISGAFTKTALSHIAWRWPRHRLTWHPESATTLLNFGKWISINSGLFFLANNGDRFMLGRLAGLGRLGVYNTAFNLSQPAALMNHHLSRSVMLPIFSRTYRDNPSQLRGAYYRARRYSDWFLLPALGMLAAGGPTIVRLLYDDRYQAGGVMLQFFMLNAALRCISDPIDSLITTIGKVHYLTWTHVLRTVTILVGLPLGWWAAGMLGAVMVVALAELPVLLLMWRIMAGEKLLLPTREALALVMILVGYVCGLGLDETVGQWVLDLAAPWIERARS